jgi:Sugar kinases, ribokinase family
LAVARATSPTAWRCWGANRSSSAPWARTARAISTASTRCTFRALTSGNWTDSFTAQAHIITDRDNNQITSFHPGAMGRAHELPVPLNAGVDLAIVAPDGRSAMIDHAAQLAAASIPFIFDPGQGMPLFDGADLRDFIAKASWVAVNDYEAELLVERTGWSLDHIASQVRGVIVTRGEHGCRIWSEGGGATDIPGVPASQVLDPTGCGDAFRAGLLFGLSKGWTLADSTRLGNVLGAEKNRRARPAESPHHPAGRA